jgi:hypothetical protein
MIPPREGLARNRLSVYEHDHCIGPRPGYSRYRLRYRIFLHGEPQ